MPDNDALERLSKKLNAGEKEEPKRTRLFPQFSSAPKAWAGSAAKPDTDLYMATKKRFSTFEKIFIASAGFFVIAVIGAGLLFLSGTNTVSTKNVSIKVAGPAEIGAGNTLTLQIVVTNGNAVPMQLTDLIVEFPPGTRSDTDVANALPRLRETLGTINPGASVNRTVKAVLFGKAGTDAPIQVSTEYRVPSSNAIFVSDTTYTTRISQSPASITVQSDSQAVSGQGATMTVTITSNSPQVLNDMLLSANYPPGFAFSDASPAPGSGTALWSLGDIEPGGTRTIVIHGVFSGEDGDQRVVNFTAGNETSSGSGTIAAPLATGEADYTVTKPFVSSSIALNGSVADSHTVARGAPVTGQIEWTNNLPVAVQNLSVTVSLQGRILDQKSVKVTQGFFNSSNATLVWDKTTDPDLANVAPGATGTLAFSFATLPAGQGSFQNPEIDLAVTVKADRTTEGNVPDTVNATAATKAIIATNLGFVASLAHTGGPLPPKANTESVYTVTWHLTNSENALAQTSVTAVLPNYARFIGNAAPSGQSVTYDDKQNIVTWNVGNIVSNGSANVSFQVGITPSVSQEGSPALVVQSQRASGFDRFVQDTVSATAPSLDTSSGLSSPQGGLVVP
jgi:hypothetical protein